MAKLTYLQLCNRVLLRCGETAISSDISSATGKQAITAQLINEAQDYLFTEVNWYSLYKTRQWATVSYKSSGTITLNENGASADTITDSSSGFSTAGFYAGQEILISGSDSNDKAVKVDTVAAGTLTLQSTDDLTQETGDAGGVTITGITYALATDHGRTIDLMDITNNSMLTPDFTRQIDNEDPNEDYTGSPDCFSLRGSNYVLQPIPAGTYQIRERYLQLPDALSADADTSDLPVECQNLIIYYALSGMLNYLQKYEAADRMYATFNRQLDRAMVANKRKINQALRLGGQRSNRNPDFPKLPTSYDRSAR